MTLSNKIASYSYIYYTPQTSLPIGAAAINKTAIAVTNNTISAWGINANYTTKIRTSIFNMNNNYTQSQFLIFSPTLI